MVRKYRLVLMLKSDLSKDARKKLIDSVKTLTGDSAAAEKELGERKLAYPIKKEQKADYVLLEVNSDQVNPNFEKRLGIQENILRHLTIREN